MNPPSHEDSGVQQARPLGEAQVILRKSHLLTLPHQHPLGRATGQCHLHLCWGWGMVSASPTAPLVKFYFLFLERFTYILSGFYLLIYLKDSYRDRGRDIHTQIVHLLAGSHAARTGPGQSKEPGTASGFFI